MEIAEWIDKRVAPRRAAAPMATEGSTGVMTQGGFIVQEDGRERRVSGLQRYRDFDLMMTNVSIVSAGIRMYLNVLAKAEWTVNPAEDQEESPQAQEIADSVYDMMFDMKTPWANVIRKLSMFRFWGFSVMEWTAKKRADGLIGMKNLSNRPQRTIVRWELDAEGEVIACYQKCFGKPDVKLDRDKLVYAVDDSLTESPEGLGLFDHLVWVTRKLREFYRLEKIGFETDLRGFPVAYAPIKEIDNDRSAHTKTINGQNDNGTTWASQLLDPMKAFVRNHLKADNQGALLDSEVYKSTTADGGAPSQTKKWGFELLQGDASSFGDIANAIVRETEAAARIIGCEHMLLGSGGDGSLALSKTKQGGFYLTITATLSDMVEILERDWLGPISALNGWADDMIPSLAVEAISDLDLAEITDALAKIAQAGATLMPDDPAIGEVRDLMGLSRPPEDGMAMDAALIGLQPPEPAAPPASGDKKPVAKRYGVRNWITSERSKRRTAKASIVKRSA